MFGTIKPCKKKCSKEELQEYKKYYCGLCFAMGEKFGNLSRFFINYEIASNFLLFSSIEGKVETESAICPWSVKHRKVTYYHTTTSDYFAKLNYILVYYKLADDIADDNSLKAKLLQKLLNKDISEVENEMHNETDTLKKYLKKLHEIEQRREHVPVFEVSHLFGSFLEEAIKPIGLSEADSAIFSKINYWMGVWIYTVDAIMDCISDGYKKRYNPILAGLSGDSLFILRFRKNELIGLLKKSRKSILELIELFPENKEKLLLKHLFDCNLPKIAYIYLGIEGDVFDT